MAASSKKRLLSDRHLDTIPHNNIYFTKLISIMSGKESSAVAEKDVESLAKKRARPSTPSDTQDDTSTAATVDYSKLPEELKNVNFTRRITWNKFAPYPDSNDSTKMAPPLPVTPVGAEPVVSPTSPALTFQVHATCGRARACTVHLTHGPVATPVFMPVGTKGSVKGVSVEEITSDLSLNNEIILANTYHLALQPTTPLVEKMGGLHKFMGWSRNILTDSGGFQMVSLLKLAEITEEGVTFESPYDNKRLLLRPEDSIQHQNEIGSDIIMALDDVVSSVTVDDTRFREATYRTLRWLDRCFAAHKYPDTQALFPIVQGGLDTNIGGLREQCLAGFRNRSSQISGYAIGGLAGGESKEQFWKVVDQCCRALPDNKPRYLMGVGYPLDLVVCTALGIDMYDCVYPTRTARFGVALVPGPAPGTLRLKNHECATDTRVVQEGCGCQACSGGMSRARLHSLLKSGNSLAAQLLTQHNIAYMMALVRNMRQAILENRFPAFARDFVKDQYPGEENGGENVPAWVKDAVASAGIEL